MSGEFKITHFNDDEFIAIANLVNEQVCKPMGEAVLAKAKGLADEFADSGEYRDTLRLETDKREVFKGNRAWARTQVVSGAKYGMQVESRHGTLARALGSL